MTARGRIGGSATRGSGSDDVAGDGPMHAEPGDLVRRRHEHDMLITPRAHPQSATADFLMHRLPPRVAQVIERARHLVDQFPIRHGAGNGSRLVQIRVQDHLSVGSGIASSNERDLEICALPVCA